MSAPVEKTAWLRRTRVRRRLSDREPKTVAFYNTTIVYLAPKIWDLKKVHFFIRPHELDFVSCIHKGSGDLRGDTAEINCNSKKLQFLDEFLAPSRKNSNY